MLESVCKTPHEVDIAFAILFAALIAVSIGKGGGKLLLDLLKKLVGHESVNINLAGGEMSDKLKECKTCGLMVDPKLCPLHELEADRSVRNKEEINEVKADLKESRMRIWDKLEAMDGTLSDIKVAVGKLVVERNYQMEERFDKRRKGV